MTRFRELRLSPEGDSMRPGAFLVDAQLSNKLGKAPPTPTEPIQKTEPKHETSGETGFLRFKPKCFEGESVTETIHLSCAETMVMVAGHESGKMQAPRRKKAPQIMGAAFKQISMIT